MMNIAIVGKMGSGKSSLANYLVDVHKYTRVANAGALKTLAEMAYGPIDKGKTYRITKPHFIPPGFGGASLVGETEYRDTEVSGREILQGIGQTLKEFDRDIWLKAMERSMMEHTGPFVCDDTRFKFEAEWLKARGWLVVSLYVPTEVRMERYKNLYGRYPTEEEMNHPSETEVYDIDYDLLLTTTVPVPELVEQIFDHVENR